MLLLQLGSGELKRTSGSELFPFIQGFARAEGATVGWYRCRCGSREAAGAPAGSPLLPTQLAAIAGLLEQHAPTLVLLDEPPPPAVEELLAGRVPPPARVCLAETTPQPADLAAETIASWLGLEAGVATGRSLIDSAVPDYEVHALPADVGDRLDYAPLLVGPECLYGSPVTSNPCYEGVPIEPTPHPGGCAFCLGGGGSHRRVGGRSPVGAALGQLARIAATRPRAHRPNRFVVRGAQLFPQLDRFLAGVCELELTPSAFFFSTRIDEFLARVPELDAWLPRLRSRGHSIHLWNMGLESFSPEENLRFNKGLTPQQLEAAHAATARLERDHPGAFVFSRHGGFSLILFTPWTTVSDLRVNLRWLQRLRYPSDFYGLVQRVQLLPGSPLRALAQRDRLVADRFDGIDYIEAPCTDRWNRVECPWRFASPVVRAIYLLMVRVHASAQIPADDPLYVGVQRTLGLAPVAERTRMAVLKTLLDLVEQEAELRCPEALLAGWAEAARRARESRPSQPEQPAVPDRHAGVPTPRPRATPRDTPAPQSRPPTALASFIVERLRPLLLAEPRTAVCRLEGLGPDRGGAAATVAVSGEHCRMEVDLFEDDGAGAAYARAGGYRICFRAATPPRERAVRWALDALVRLLRAAPGSGRPPGASR